MGDPQHLHGTGQPSDWVLRWANVVPAAARVLDVASGAGRHSRVWAARGCRVTAVDRNPAALEQLEGVNGVRVVQADLESGPWPLPGEVFDAVVITNYLWRPLWPSLLGSLAPGGLLVVETFALGHERLGRPSNPQFLLRPGELLDVARDLHVIAFEDGQLDNPPRRVQRIAALKAVHDDPSTAGDVPLHPAR